MEAEAATFALAIINLSDPRKVGGALGKHIEYDMKTTKLRAEIDLEEKTVVRRFSDFFTLHDILASKYAGMLLPPMPEKKFVGQLRDEFIKTRMTDLERFVGRLLANPYIQSDNALKQFLILEHAAWGAFVKEQAAPDATQTDEGVRKWQAVKGAIPKVALKDTVFESLSKELEEMEAALNAVCHSVVNLAKSASALNEVRESTTDTVHKHGQTLQEISVDNKLILPGMSNNLSESGKILATAGRALDSWKALYDGQASEVMTYVAESARDDLQHIRAFRQLIRRFDSAKATYKKAFQIHDKKGFELKKQKDKGGKQEQIDKLEALLKTLKEQMDSAQDDVQMQARALLCSELKRYSNWRYTNTRRYIAQFAATSLENAEREIELWQRVIDELELDADEISEMAKQTSLMGDLELLPHGVDVDMHRKGERSGIAPPSPAAAVAEEKKEASADEEEFEEAAAAAAPSAKQPVEEEEEESAPAAQTNDDAQEEEEEKEEEQEEEEEEDEEESLL